MSMNPALKEKRIGLAVAAVTAAGGLFGAGISGAAGIALPLLFSTAFISGCMGAIAVGGRDGWLPAAGIYFATYLYLQWVTFAKVSGDAGLGVALISGSVLTAIAAALVGSIVGAFFGKRERD